MTTTKKPDTSAPLDDLHAECAQAITDIRMKFTMLRVRVASWDLGKYVDVPPTIERKQPRPSRNWFR